MTLYYSLVSSLPFFQLYFIFLSSVNTQLHKIASVVENHHANDNLRSGFYPKHTLFQYQSTC